MVKNLNEKLSIISNRMRKSEIRELLKLTQKPEIISFAGGLPSPESFPVEQLKEVMNEVMDKEASVVLQYGTTEGDPVLKEVLIKRYAEQGVNVDMKNIMIVTASQQSLDLISRVFLNEGDTVICGLPSYLGGLNCFKNCGAELVGIKFDDKGMNAELLEAEIKRLIEENKKPKFIYVIPDFQNPAGVTMPESRRKEILAIAHKYNVLILEDSPYRELRFTGEAQKTMYELDNGSGQVMTLGTFSKILVPGFRLGWILADEDILDRIIMAKQSADLCTSLFNQRVTARFMEKGYLDGAIERVIKIYGEKRKVMLDMFEQYMPEGVSWVVPEGGLFLFMTMPEKIDASELLKVALKNNVAFVIGQVFHCDGSGKNTMRINFSYASIEMIKEGVKRLADSIKEML